MATEIGAIAGRFFAWWKRELANALPSAFRGLLPGRGPRLDVTAESGALLLNLNGGAAVRQELRIEKTELPPDRQTRRAIASMTADADEIVLRLGKRQVLRPTFDLPISAGNALEAKLAAEIERRTPFRAVDVVWDWRVIGSDVDLERLYVELLIARRQDVASSLTLVRSVGISLDRIDGPVEAEPKAWASFSLLRPERRQRRRSPTARLIRPLAMATAGLAVTWSILALERREMELSALQTRLDELRQENAAIIEMESHYEALLEARSFVSDHKRATIPALEILAEITRRLPDGDWVSSYSVDGEKLTLAGFSRDASRLPLLLEGSDYLSAVAFAAPLRRDHQRNGDEFTITAALERSR